MALVESHGVTLQLSGVEAHNSLGNGERYYDPLRRAYVLPAKNTPPMSKNLFLRYAVNGVNSTANIYGLVPSLLALGVVLSFPSTNKALSNQRGRLQAVFCVRLEMGKIVYEQRFTCTMKWELPPAGFHDISVAEQFFCLWREE